MKKINVLIISFLFLLTNNIQASLFQAPNPYSFGPQGRAVSDLRDFAKPKQMVNILAGRPVVATKSDGTRVYYTPDGKMSLAIKENGEMSFSLSGYSKSLDKFGNLRSEVVTHKNNLQEVKNEFGETQSYNQLDGNGNVIISYDKDMNKTATYDYGKYGKKLESSINEMTKQKTVYDEHERPMAVYTAEGRIITTYQYTDVDYDTDQDCLELIITKKEVKTDSTKMETSKNYMSVSDDVDVLNSEMKGHFECSVTHYKDDGVSVDYVVNANGETIAYYCYDKDIYGNEVLTSVFNPKTQERTFYENGKQSYTVNAKGGKIKQYYWEGSKFLFSVDLGEDGKWIRTTNSDNITTYSNIVYNKDGTINTVSDENGNIIEKYYYKEDADGNSILDYVENVVDGSKTYYDEDGHSTQTIDVKGNVLTDYSWNKSDLVYSFDRKTGITTWYAGSGTDKEVQYEYKSLNDQLISKDIYSAGQLIGKWNAKAGDLVLYINEQERITLTNYTEEPTVGYIRKIISDYIEEQEKLKN